MHHDPLRLQAERACRRLVSQQHRDPYAVTRGCFDRRYWAWKLCDMPEATWQRAVLPLAWWMEQQPAGSSARAVLEDAVISGLEFAAAIQHRDGSFDQAFPNEHSFGATAVLLQPCLKAYAAVRDACAPDARERIERMCRNAAAFLCTHREHHGYISNHLAGAALALQSAADSLGDRRFRARASDLRDDLIDRQSAEGWFPEYGGADPGYQTLCVSYLAELHAVAPDARLHDALGRAVSFLAWFAHPCGSFGGEYGSRRTSLFYPAGIARLSPDFPDAHALSSFMARAISEGRTTSLDDLDMGNLVPMLSDYVQAMAVGSPGKAPIPLPCERMETRADFPEAGLHVRGTAGYFAVAGASSGGVLRVFDRRTKRAHDDGGYVGRFRHGAYVTSQTRTDVRSHLTGDTLQIDVALRRLRRARVSPALMVVLRLLNLTVMRSVGLGNLVKKMMAGRLLQDDRVAPLRLTRRITFGPTAVVVDDTIVGTGDADIEWLECGRRFVSIHMASAAYFESFTAAGGGESARRVDVGELRARGQVHVHATLGDPADAVVSHPC